MTVKQFFQIIKPEIFNRDFPYTIEVKWKEYLMYIETYSDPQSKNWLTAFPGNNRKDSNVFNLKTFNDLEILNPRDLIDGVFISL